MNRGISCGRAALLCLHLTMLFAVASSQPCEADCQAEQHRALQLLHQATGGPTWQIPTQWDTATPSFQTGTMPAHCSWYRVVCCTLTGQYGTPGQGFGPLLPANLTTAPCNTPAGVLYLTLQLTNLTGTLPAEAFTQLTTLTGLDVSGMSGRFGAFTPDKA